MTFGNLSDEISKKRFIEEAQKLSPISIPILESTPKKSSAVLVPLIASKEFEGGLGILYCKRSTFLRRHAREICFPGGKIDPDETPIQAAIRECVEEIGIDKNQVEVWTSFPELPDIFGIKGDVNNDPFNNGNIMTPTIPIIGQIKDYNPYKLKLNCKEVSEVFVKGVYDLHNPKVAKSTQFRYPGTNGYSMPVYLTKPYPIWGMTATITFQLLSVLLKGRNRGFNHLIHYQTPFK